MAYNILMKKIERAVAEKAAAIMLPFATDYVLRRSTRIRESALASRRFRIIAEEASDYQTGCAPAIKRFALGTLKTGVEYIPTGVLWLGVGDLIVLGESAFGRDFPSGERRDAQDRIVGAVLAGIPGVPSVPARAFYRGLRHNIEEEAYRIQNEIDSRSI